MEACFDDMALWPGGGLGLASAQRRMSASLQARLARPAISELAVRNACLWGGNLTVMCSMVGTPWLPEIKGGVLFLEDVNEHPYRIERQLTQLMHTRAFIDRQKAVVLGAFNRYKASPHDKGFKLQTVVDWLRSKTKTPVLDGAAFWSCAHQGDAAGGARRSN